MKLKNISFGSIKKEFSKKFGNLNKNVFNKKQSNNFAKRFYDSAQFHYKRSYVFPTFFVVGAGLATLMLSEKQNFIPRYQKVVEIHHERELPQDKAEILLKRKVKKKPIYQKKKLRIKSTKPDLICQKKKKVMLIIFFF